MATDQFIIEMPAEHFLAIVTLVSQAAERNKDHRVKGFYLGVLRNLRTAYQDNAEPTDEERLKEKLVSELIEPLFAKPE